jgi:hypothetical protein
VNTIRNDLRKRLELAAECIAKLSYGDDITLAKIAEKITRNVLEAHERGLIEDNLLRDAIEQATLPKGGFVLASKLLPNPFFLKLFGYVVWKETREHEQVCRLAPGTISHAYLRAFEPVIYSDRSIAEVEQDGFKEAKAYWRKALVRIASEIGGNSPTNADSTPTNNDAKAAANTLRKTIGDSMPLRQLLICVTDRMKESGRVDWFEVRTDVEALAKDKRFNRYKNELEELLVKNESGRCQCEETIRCWKVAMKGISSDSRNEALRILADDFRQTQKPS